VPDISIPDITIPELTVPDEIPALPTLEIAARMIERAPGITRLLDRLEAKRMIRRERCPTDRREVTCRISEPGLQLLKRMEETVNRADHAAIKNLAARELEQLIALLDGVRREVGSE
jgi:DNA-binding MarR family transcriptional regulator